MRLVPWNLSGKPVRISVLLCLGLWMASVALAPREGSSQSTPLGQPGRPYPPAAVTATGKPLLPDWPNPLAAFVFSGDVHGYLEPCGCSERQAGGFARRSDLLRQLRTVRGWPTAAFDVGGSLRDSRISYPQTAIKFGIMLKGLSEMGYQGTALGTEELLLGPQELFTQHSNLSAEPGFDVPFLDANAMFYGTPGTDLGTPLPARIIQVGPLKVGVVAITGNSSRKLLEVAGALSNPAELKVDDPVAALQAVLPQLKAQRPHLLILLSHAELEESKQLARQFADEFQIVVTSGSVEDPRPDPVYIGKSLLVQVGKKGKNAAVVGVYPNNQLKYTVLELDMDRFQADPRMLDLMRDYQDRLKSAWPQLSTQEIPDPPGGTFVGVQECKGCHEAEYAVWEGSKHAEGYESLIHGRAGTVNPISRIYDPECLCCHVTGWDPQRALRYKSGFIDMEKTPLLAGQQCENCHGPGSEHVVMEKGVAAGGPINADVLKGRESIRLTLEEAKASKCVSCHDHENDPKYDFDLRWPDIEH